MDQIVTGKSAGLAKDEIWHMVMFSLKHAEGSQEAENFLRDGSSVLPSIPVVRQFEVLRQVSPKNNFHYGFSMVFANQADYDTYNQHPEHVRFVEERWKKEVEDFLEMDFMDGAKA